MTARGITGVAGVEGIALKERIIQAASKIFVEEGYQSLSMRRVAQEAGCSQMAMYRHFDNKEALTQHICAQLYTRFATKITREIEGIEGPWERLRRFSAALIRFAVSYPDHYALIFLVRHSDPVVLADRERLGQEFLAGIHDIVAALLPQETPAPAIEMKLRQMMCCLHGTAALLIAHPKAYSLTKQKAIEDSEATLRSLFG
ncbi:MAG: Transcriptional regulator, TetR family [Acidobacteriaceae bacterium]|nr:Transcriptional regulator, TetR family [Acidobacteriaceae bacterium]